MNSCNAIGNRIEKLRKTKGLTQLQLSEKLMVKRETVVQWETGTRDLKTDYTVKLADFFGVSCDYILRGVETPNVSLNKLTGLSDAAVDSISVLNKISSKNGWDAVNYILTSPYFTDLVKVIARIGSISLNRKKRNSPIEDIEIIPISNLGTAELIWTFNNQDRIDIETIWNRAENKSRDALEKCFGEDSLIVSATAAIKYISQNQAQRLLTLLMDKLIDDASNDKLKKIEGETELEQSERLSSVLIAAGQLNVLRGIKTKEDQANLISEIKTWENDIKAGQKTVTEYIYFLENLIKKEGIPNGDNP